MNDYRSLSKLRKIVLKNLPEMNLGMCQMISRNPLVIRRFLVGLPDAFSPVFGRSGNITYREGDEVAGCTRIEPATARAWKFVLVARDFIEVGKSIKGEDMIARAKGLGRTTGLQHAQGILREPWRIPIELDKKVLVFPETWRNREGILGVFCLFKIRRRWYVRHMDISRFFSHSFCLATAQDMRKIGHRS